MKDEKFVNDAQTVLKFIQLHCDEKHECEKKKGIWISCIKIKTFYM